MRLISSWSSPVLVSRYYNPLGDCWKIWTVPSSLCRWNALPAALLKVTQYPRSFAFAKERIFAIPLGLYHSYRPVSLEHADHFGSGDSSIAVNFHWTEVFTNVCQEVSVTELVDWRLVFTKGPVSRQFSMAFNLHEDDTVACSRHDVHVDELMFIKLVLVIEETNIVGAFGDKRRSCLFLWRKLHLGS